MIFVTVGTQLPFDRMVNTVNDWVSGRSVEVVAQVGPTNCEFVNLKSSKFLDPLEFDRYFGEASLIVAHAGMGSILTALTYGKPIVIMPRNARLGEHRNDHQMATARKFSGNDMVRVVWDEQELIAILNAYDIRQGEEVRGSRYAKQSFIDNLRSLINS